MCQVSKAGHCSSSAVDDLLEGMPLYSDASWVPCGDAVGVYGLDTAEVEGTKQVSAVVLFC